MPLPKPYPQTQIRLATKRFLSIPQCLKPGRPPSPPATSMHRCLLISEIFHLVLEFIHQDQGSPEEHECESLGKRTLASLAQTCRAFSAPALNVLWMRLHSLDPLIKVLPSRIWAKKHSRFVVRILLNEKHWLRFKKYAERVRFLRGPCRSIPPSVQHNVFATLARFAKAPFPLLPNLTELVWTESDTFSVVDPTVSLIKFFAGRKVTSISLFLVSWPIYVSARNVLADLPNLFQNVTSFTAIPRATLDDHSRDIGDIVCKWPNLRELRSCALSQEIMDELASQQTLNSISIELNSYVSDVFVDKLPTTVHTFSLEGRNASQCIRYLQTLQGTPTSFHLYVGLDFTLPPDMDALFRMLPIRFDTTQLRDLTISLRLTHSRVIMLHSFMLTEPLLAPLYAFSALVSLDLDRFCASELNDAAYEQMAGAWPDLRSLKVGAEDVSGTKPVASVGAVIAVLRSCLRLQTLHIVFDGSVSPPPPREVEAEAAEDGKEKRAALSRALGWGISNQHISQIHVGSSPVREDIAGMKELASCLKSVMPQLERIQSTKVPRSTLDSLHTTESDGWQTVQHLLMEDDKSSASLPEATRFSFFPAN